jgi:hypothetical protein
MPTTTFFNAFLPTLIGGLATGVGAFDGAPKSGIEIWELNNGQLFVADASRFLLLASVVNAIEKLI